MEQKKSNQSTYYVYPYVVKESKYPKYMLRLLRDKRVKLRIFEKEKDLRLYKYFTPKVREFLFSSFSMPYSKARQLEELPIETKAATISQIPCAILDYDIEGKQEKDEEDQDIKETEQSQIEKLELICFNTGICFIVLKTKATNLNEKFEEVNHEFINDIIGSKIETMKLGLNTEKFFTYSYEDVQMKEFTTLPEEYENQYFYIYILELYKKIYLKKINYEFKNAEKPKDIKETRKRFVDFTQHLWILEVTDDEAGNILNQKFKQKFQIENMYHKMKNKYDILYKEMNIEKNARRIKIITVILIATLIFNVLNFIMLIKK